MSEKNSGFTLAEVLIVVAIVAVLVAISIPLFSAQLEKSREATDMANIRAQYAILAANVMTEAYSTDDVYRVALKQKQEGWQSFEDDTKTPLHTTFGGHVIGYPKPAEHVYATLYYQPEEEAFFLTFGTSLVNYGEKIKQTFKDFFLRGENLTGITSWDSKYSGHAGINAINAALAGNPDVKSWAIINPKKGTENKFPYANNPQNTDKLNQNKDANKLDESEKDLYYLWTAVDITGRAGEVVPVMVAYTDATGQKVYSVSNITVTYGDGTGYNVITGNNPRPSGNGYDINAHLGQNGGRQDFFTNYDAAYAEYERRLQDMYPTVNQ